MTSLLKEVLEEESGDVAFEIRGVQCPDLCMNLLRDLHEGGNVPSAVVTGMQRLKPNNVAATKHGVPLVELAVEVGVPKVVIYSQIPPKKSWLDEQKRRGNTEVHYVDSTIPGLTQLRKVALLLLPQKQMK